MFDFCTLKSWADLGEGLFGIAAAGFWFWSVGVHWFLSTETMGDLARNTRLSSKLNAFAALFAGLVALLQVFIHYAPACRDFG